MTPRTIRRACAELAYLAEAAGEERLRQMGRLVGEIVTLSGVPPDDPSGTDPLPAVVDALLPVVAGLGAMGVAVGGGS